MEEFALKIIDFYQSIVQFLAENPTLAERLEYLAKGFFLGLLLFGMFMLVRFLVYLPSVRPKRVEKAKAKGHIIEATFSKDWIGYPDDNRKRKTKVGGIYTYPYKNGTCKYKHRCGINTPEKITLYYMKNAKKAQTENRLGYGEPTWKTIYLIFGLICTVICYVFKFQW